jgi:cation diffusion facilitator CzcD-associated flavoprotein CzcO
MSITYDVIIVGAGISGIGTAHWLQRKCPGKSFLLLEAREEIGGTWSLFRYPGVRSDSDMFTFGYRFRPWQRPQSISSGEDILDYLRDTVDEYGLEPYIRYRHKLVAADWSDESATWQLTVDRGGEEIELRCRFLSICSGYYDYDEAHRPRFPGEENFGGRIVQPQFWPEDLDYRGTRAVVIGSGATAVTLVPSMADGGAEHVTMLQRSPTYIMNLPNRNGLFVLLKNILPANWAYRIARWSNISLSMASFAFAKRFPGLMRRYIMNQARKELPAGYPVERHFNPSYDPWDQRLCVIPDGDLYRVIREGKASVVTDHIEKFTSGGIRTQSGEEVAADLVVVATGLKIHLVGGARISVNGEEVSVNQSMIYKGMMVSDVPNLIYAFGYTNASWTLKVDLTANYLCKLLRYMDRKGYTVVTPVAGEMDSDESFLNLDAGYIRRAAQVLPKQGKRRPWRVVQNYLVDMLSMRFGRVADGVLQFGRHRMP